MDILEVDERAEPIYTVMLQPILIWECAAVMLNTCMNFVYGVHIKGALAILLDCSGVGKGKCWDPGGHSEGGSEGQGCLQSAA